MNQHKHRPEINMDFGFAPDNPPYGVLSILSATHYDWGESVVLPLHFFVRRTTPVQLVKDAAGHNVFFVTIGEAANREDSEMQEFVLNLVYAAL